MRRIGRQLIDSRAGLVGHRLRFMFSNESVAKAGRFGVPPQESPEGLLRGIGEKTHALGLLERLYQKLPKGTAA